MNRNAAEILRHLEARIARLEGQPQNITRTASVLDTLRNLPRARELSTEVENVRKKFLFDLGDTLDSKSERVTRPPQAVFGAKDPMDYDSKTTKFSDVSETDLAEGKLLVPCTVNVRMFFRAPIVTFEYVKMGRGKRGTKSIWGYRSTPEDAKEKAEVVKAVQSVCEKMGVVYSNIEFPVPDMRSGFYPSIYGTLTFKLDMSHFLQ